MQLSALEMCSIILSHNGCCNGRGYEARTDISVRARPSALETEESKKERPVVPLGQ